MYRAIARLQTPEMYIESYLGSCESASSTIAMPRSILTIGAARKSDVMSIASNSTIRTRESYPLDPWFSAYKCVIVSSLGVECLPRRLRFSTYVLAGNAKTITYSTPILPLFSDMIDAQTQAQTAKTARGGTY